MRRTDRLFELMLLFRHPRLWRGKELAEQLEVSLRTIYRDIDTLVGSGVPIEGARGVGYILRAPIFLPPLTLSTTELEALHLGVEIVRKHGDSQLSEAATRLLAKINAVVPSDLAHKKFLADVQVFGNDFENDLSGDKAQLLPHLAPLRQAIVSKDILEIDYVRLDNVTTTRRIRPLHIEFWGHVWTCTLWCELRNGFRVMRIDRITSLTQTGENFSLEPGKTFDDYLAHWNSKDAAK